MSEKLPNLSYYDSTGQAYGFTKPYSDDRARMIDEEVSRIIHEQYERAKDILRQYAEGHNKLADVLYTREVIFTEDVEHIFGKRKWASRTEEILAAQQAANVTMTPPPTIPPIPGKEQQSSDDGGNTTDTADSPTDGDDDANQEN
jgi:cell division protease FtsH